MHQPQSTKKNEVQENMTQRQRQRQGNHQRRLSLAHVQKVVNTDKVDKLEKYTAEHRTTALQKIQAREKKADARVRQRLRDKRKKKLENEKKNDHSTKVVPIATPLLPNGGVTPTTAQASAVAVAAAVASIPSEKIVAQKDIDAICKSIHDKVRNENKLKVLFGKLDKDKSLTLSRKEFRKLIAKVVQPPPTKNMFKAIWKDVCHLRKTGDGVNEIDFATFKVWLGF